MPLKYNIKIFYSLKTFILKKIYNYIKYINSKENKYI